MSTEDTNDTPDLKIVECDGEESTDTSPDVSTDDPRHNTPVDRHAIREVRSYVDDKGREVKEFVQVFGKSKSANFYKGRAVIQVRMAGPGGVPMPPRHQPFEFDIEATGVKKAFELFDQAAEEELARMREAQKERDRIAVPGQGPSILGPGGKPIGG